MRQPCTQTRHARANGLVLTLSDARQPGANVESLVVFAIITMYTKSATSLSPPVRHRSGQRQKNMSLPEQVRLLPL